VSDDSEDEARRRQREADLVQNRIAELYENPVRGKFDAEHLKAVHAYIFQDTPHHQPGVTRGDTPSWTKHRGLEGRPGGHDVPYVSHDVEGKITVILEQFGGPDSLKGLTLEAAAGRIAGLYGDLD
jgi:cell filamentation protein